ncbi:MAG: rod shape-determining protein MreD [Clostridia bacterium]|nr:rod shape-determining protein MreD [Clostridia bacterium]
MVENNKRVTYLTHITTSLILALLYLVQYSFGLIPKINGATALLLVPAIIAIGARMGEWCGFTYGLMFGFLLDSISADTVFFHTICLALIGFFAGFLISHLFNRNIISVIILGLGGCFVFFTSKLLVYAFSGCTGILSYFMYHSLPSTIYSFVFIVPLFYLFGKISKDTSFYTQNQ